MDNNYLAAVREHASTCVRDLKVYSTHLKQGQLSQTEYYAAERLLQVLIESAIGLCKNWVKEIDHIPPGEAYANFNRLYEKKIISHDQLEQWRKIIGLRNVLVHDYLKIEPRVIEGVLKNELYHFILNFMTLY